MKRKLLLGALAMASIAGVASAAVNPFGIAYSDVTGADQYGKPAGMLIAGRCNRYDPAFAEARAKGAEVLTYIDAIERPDTKVCTLDEEFYMGDHTKVPLWRDSVTGVPRVNWPGHTLTDIKVGSAWSNHVVEYVEKLIREDRVDGVFLDVLGSRLWGSLSKWDSWPASEREDWTRGAVDLACRIDALRRKLRPSFIVVNNNIWGETNITASHPGELCVDGVVLEKPSSSPAMGTWHQVYAARPFGSLHRRVLIISPDAATAAGWAMLSGVTNVASTPYGYGKVTAPPVSFTRMTDRPRYFGATTSGSTASAALGKGAQVSFKFQMKDTGRLLRLRAKLDGAGGASGYQSFRITVKAADGTTVAESSTVNLESGAVSGGVTFSIPQVPIRPGTYTLTLLAGSGAGVARYYFDLDSAGVRIPALRAYYTTGI